ncbi:MAG: hypothetical protein ABR906_05870 [Terracidiphilus sp.]
METVASPLSCVIFPWFDQQKLEVGMATYCRTCGLSNFRTSRFRVSDLSQLFILRLPVRCLNCDERAFTSVMQFIKLRSARKARHRERHQQRNSAI